MPTDAREELPETDYSNTVAALQEVLTDIAQGDTGQPLDGFGRAFREKHHLPRDF